MNNTTELKGTPFFYILSMGRSGSTLLEFLLDAHPNINIPLESRFIIHLYYKYAKKNTWTKKEKLTFIKDLYTDNKLTDFWNINNKQLEKDILETKSNISFFELCRIITANYISFYPKEEIKIQGSKNPIYGLWSDELYQLDKDAKFIHLVRNPMGVAASQKKLNHKHTFYYAYRWNLIQKKVEALKKKSPASFITVNYENLIKEPEKELKRLSKFLGVNFIPEQLHFYETIKNVHDQITNNNEIKKLQKFNSHLKNLTQPIQKSIGESWKDTLSIKEQTSISYITNSYAKVYGYNHNIDSGNFQFAFIFAKIKLKYRYLKHKLYYRLSLSIK
jgi:hypothetical protein